LSSDYDFGMQSKVYIKFVSNDKLLLTKITILGELWFAIKIYFGCVKSNYKLCKNDTTKFFIYNNYINNCRIIVKTIVFVYKIIIVFVYLYQHILKKSILIIKTIKNNSTWVPTYNPPRQPASVP